MFLTTLNIECSLFGSDFKKCFSLVGKGQNILESAKVHAYSKKSVFGKKIKRTFNSDF